MIFETSCRNAALALVLMCLGSQSVLCNLLVNEGREAYFRWDAELYIDDVEPRPAFWLSLKTAITANHSSLAFFFFWGGGGGL